LLQGEKLYFQVYGLTTVNKVVKQDHGEPNIYLLLKWEHMLYTYTGGRKFLLPHFYLFPYSESEISWVKACFQCQLHQITYKILQIKVFTILKPMA